MCALLTVKLLITFFVGISFISAGTVSPVYYDPVFSENLTIDRLLKNVLTEKKLMPSPAQTLSPKKKAKRMLSYLTVLEDFLQNFEKESNYSLMIMELLVYYKALPERLKKPAYLVLKRGLELLGDSCELSQLHYNALMVHINVLVKTSVNDNQQLFEHRTFGMSETFLSRALLYHDYRAIDLFFLTNNNYEQLFNAAYQEILRLNDLLVSSHEKNGIASFLADFFSQHPHVNLPGVYQARRGAKKLARLAQKKMLMHEPIFYLLKEYLPQSFFPRSQGAFVFSLFQHTLGRRESFFAQLIRLGDYDTIAQLFAYIKNLEEILQLPTLLQEALSFLIDNRSPFDYAATLYGETIGKKAFDAHSYLAIMGIVALYDHRVQNLSLVEGAGQRCFFKKDALIRFARNQLTVSS